MADLTGKSITFKLDNASATLTALTAHLNAASLTAMQNVLGNDALDDDEHVFLSGLAGSTLNISGFWNSTTEGIFGPLIGQRTSITKTFEHYSGVKYLNGECYLTNIQVSGAVDTVQTFSADAQITGGVNRTSVAL